MENEIIYIFQNWLTGCNTLEEFKEWDIDGEIYKKLKRETIYKHTDNGEDGFLYISLNKDKLKEFAIKKRDAKVNYMKRKIESLNKYTFNGFE